MVLFAHFKKKDKEPEKAKAKGKEKGKGKGKETKEKKPAGPKESVPITQLWKYAKPKERFLVWYV